MPARSRGPTKTVPELDSRTCLKTTRFSESRELTVRKLLFYTALFLLTAVIYAVPILAQKTAAPMSPHWSSDLRFESANDPGVNTVLIEELFRNNGSSDRSELKSDLLNLRAFWLLATVAFGCSI
jgi:hypothetical protein